MNSYTTFHLFQVAHIGAFSEYNMNGLRYHKFLRDKEEI